MTEEDAGPWIRYDSRTALECCAFPQLRRRIGVSASRPFHHHGLNAEYVDVTRETVKVNTQTWGTGYPSETAGAEIARATRSTIQELDIVIKELVQHRHRLECSLGSAGADYEKGLIAQAEAPDVIDVELPAYMSRAESDGQLSAS